LIDLVVIYVTLIPASMAVLKKEVLIVKNLAALRRFAEE